MAHEALHAAAEWMRGDYSLRAEHGEARGEALCEARGEARAVGLGGEGEGGEGEGGEGEGGAAAGGEVRRPPRLLGTGGGFVLLVEGVQALTLTLSLTLTLALILTLTLTLALALSLTPTLTLTLTRSTRPCSRRCL